MHEDKAGTFFVDPAARWYNMPKDQQQAFNRYALERSRADPSKTYEQWRMWLYLEEGGERIAIDLLPRGLRRFIVEKEKRIAEHVARRPRDVPAVLQERLATYSEADIAIAHEEYVRLMLT